MKSGSLVYADTPEKADELIATIPVGNRVALFSPKGFPLSGRINYWKIKQDRDRQADLTEVSAAFPDIRWSVVDEAPTLTDKRKLPSPVKKSMSSDSQAVKSNAKSQWPGYRPKKYFACGKLPLLFSVGCHPDLLPHFLAHYQKQGITSFIAVVWKGGGLDAVKRHLRGRKKINHLIIRPGIRPPSEDQERDFLNQVRRVHIPGDTWYVTAEMNEFHEVPGYTLKKAVAGAKKAGASAILGVRVDCATANGKAPRKIKKNLWKQFPVQTARISGTETGTSHRVIACRSDAKRPAKHSAENRASPDVIQAWHVDGRARTIRLETNAASRVVRFQIMDNPPVTRITPASDVAALACHFNFAGYDTPKRNLHRWCREMAKMGIAVHGMELVLAHQEPTTSGLAGWTQQVVPNRAVLWQKEAVLNALARRLPASVEYVLCIDTDIWFERPDWLEATRDALSRHQVVQLFDESVWTNHFGQSILRYQSTGSLRTVMANGQWSSHPGFAWAFQRRFWREVGGWYDLAPMGSGDTILAAALTGEYAMEFARRAVGQNYRLYQTWARQIREWAGESWGCVKGTVWHEWHGDRADRDYMRRNRLLSLMDAEQHLIRRPGGWLEWTDAAPTETVRFAHQYLLDRKEDG